MQLMVDFFSTLLSENSLFLNRLGLTIVVIAGLCGCDHQINSDFKHNKAGNIVKITPIGKIKLVKDHELTLYFQGKVIKQAPLLTQQAYQISDTTAKIWVVTPLNHWQIGQEVLFKGRVKYGSIILSGKDYGETYLEEE